MRPSRDVNDSEISSEDRRAFSIKKGCLFQHKKIQLNYTTYDLRRDRDIINPSSITTDVMVIMMASDDDEKQMEYSPFWYARVIGVFHAMVTWGYSTKAKRVNFVWVRWFGRDADWRFGDDTARLEKIGFVTEEDDTPAFGFIDPQSIVRAVHLIPDFNEGRVDNGLVSPTLARVNKHDCDYDDDWAYFYVNKSVNFSSFRVTCLQ